MSDPFRKIDMQYSPKSSPRGSRSPVVPPRQDSSSSGTLKATISLGKNPSIVHTGPFYLLKEPPPPAELTGATNLMAFYGLEHSYNKSSGRKVKDTLSSFLPNIPGYIDSPGYDDNSSLQSLIDKPPILGKEILPLTAVQLSGFRLHPGPLPEQYRLLNQGPPKKKQKSKRSKYNKDEDTPNHADSSAAELAAAAEKKHKKQKRHDEEKERKKRKKDKKKKKSKNTPEHPPSAALGGPGPSTSQQMNASLFNMGGMGNNNN